MATIATIIAATMTASNLGSKITGYGFAVFLLGSMSWLGVGILTDQPALTWTNAVLTLLNIFGVWRWLGQDLKHPALAPIAKWFDRHIPPERRIVPPALAA